MTSLLPCRFCSDTVWVPRWSPLSSTLFWHIENGWECPISQSFAEAGHYCGQWLAESAFPTISNVLKSGTRKRRSAGSDWWQENGKLSEPCFIFSSSLPILNNKKLHVLTQKYYSLNMLWYFINELYLSILKNIN